MSSTELTEWTAYERVYGSLLPHERIDAGFAQVSWLMACLWGSKKRGEYKIRDFMPRWYQDLTAADSVRSTFEAMLKQAEANADN